MALLWGRGYFAILLKLFSLNSIAKAFLYSPNTSYEIERQQMGVC